MPNPRWGLLLLLGGLSAFFFYCAVRPSAGRGWGWGRSGQAGPISRASYAVIGALVLCTGLLGGFSWDSLPKPLLGWLGVNLAAFFIAGLADAHRNRHGASGS